MDATSPRRIVATSGPTATLEEVDILRELDTRPARSPDYETQNRALAALAEEMAVNPRNMLQRLVEVAVDLCQADTSGISLLEGDVFRWEAVAGVFAGARNGTMPRDASPCGVVIDRDRDSADGIPGPLLSSVAGGAPLRRGIAVRLPCAWQTCGDRLDREPQARAAVRS